MTFSSATSVYSLGERNAIIDAIGITFAYSFLMRCSNSATSGADPCVT
jgi:hypothetical protein